MLFSPGAHERLRDKRWSTEQTPAAIAEIVADAEAAFDDG